MVDGWGVCVETHFENVIVVWRYSKTGHKAVNVQIEVLADDVLTPRKCLCVWWWIEQE